MGVALGVEVAAGQVPEERRHYAAGGDAALVPGAGRPPARMEQLAVDEGERRRDGLAVGAEQPGPHPAAGADERLHGEGLGQREREVDAGTVLPEGGGIGLGRRRHAAPAPPGGDPGRGVAPPPPEADRRAGEAALEEVAEGFGFDGPPEAEGLGPRAEPAGLAAPAEALAAVLGAVVGEVAHQPEEPPVAPEVPEGARGALEHLAGDHRSGRPGNSATAMRHRTTGGGPGGPRLRPERHGPRLLSALSRNPCAVTVPENRASRMELRRLQGMPPMSGTGVGRAGGGGSDWRRAGARRVLA